MSPILLLGAAAGTLIAQIVTVVLGFFVVVWILKAFAWGPIIQAIDDRRNEISQEFTDIEQKQATLNSQIKDYEERLRQIDAEARERTNKAIEEGRKAAETILADAKKSADDLKAKAENDIKLEIEKSRVELRDEIVSLTIKATEKLLKSELNDDRHKELVGTFIRELESEESKL